MKEISFIHAADLHLDSPFSGLSHLPEELFRRIQESTFNALDCMVAEALDREVDFVLISGDLYDGEDRSIKAQARLRRQMERLREKGIAVFLLHGNHDHLSGQWTAIEMPDNVHVFGPDVEMKRFVKNDGTTVHIYGFSYQERHIAERRIMQYEKQGEADFHIGMLHGHCEGGSSDHQPYAPFSVQELLDRDYDYWALGHIHQRQVLYHDPPIIYSGNIQGRSIKETGEKGCLHVQLSEWGDPHISFVETSDVIWESHAVDAAHCRSLSEVYSLCREHISQCRRPGKGILLQLEAKLGGELPPDVLMRIDNGELQETLQDEEDLGREFVWVHRLEARQGNVWRNREEFEHFITELDKTIAEAAGDSWFESALSDLFSHPQAIRFANTMDAKDKDRLLDEARELILHELVNSQ